MSQRKSVNFQDTATVGEVNEMMDELKLKQEAKADDDGTLDLDGELDLSGIKKKKKKKKKTPTADADFEAKLKESGEKEGQEAATEEDDIGDGDMEKGTGIWAHDTTRAIPYKLLLSRFFTLLYAYHPESATGGPGGKSYKIPPPQCLREGNKKTIFANIAEISKRINRNEEHVTQFLFAELGTSGSIDANRRLVIKGRFQQKQIENVLRRYIVEYVTCRTCRSPNTELSKGENRLYFITCKNCLSRRSVAAIKTGFSAQVGKRKKQQG